MPKKPRLKERRNRMWSVARKHNRHTVHQKYMKAMFMPMLRCTWKGYGVNHAVWNTAVDLDSQKWITNPANDAGPTVTYSATSGLADPRDVDNAVDTSDVMDWLNRAGDLNAISCLPGRQIYMEFAALPQFRVSDAKNINTTKSSDFMKSGYCRSVFDLFQTALNNHAFTTGGHLAHETYIPATNATTSSTQFYNEMLKGSYNWNGAPSNNYEAHRIIHSRFLYEGGQQVHKFTNETTLPIYIEVREFVPRNMMDWSYSLIDTPDDQYATGNVTAFRAARWPGMYESIYEDRKMQCTGWSGTTTTTLNHHQDQTKLFDELSDKDFKYKGDMPITDMRWKVGDAKVHRIDPGETFTYTMILPPFSVRMRDILRFTNNWRGYTSSLSGQNQFDWGRKDGTTTTEDNNKPYAINPLFTKFVQIRARGSNGFVRIKNPDGTDAGLQFDSFRDAERKVTVNNVDSYVNFDTDNQLINGAGAMENTRVNPTSIKAVLTHAAMLTHTMSETHQCRILPFVRPYAIEKFDWTPNAADARLVTIGDDVEAVDPAENRLENVDGEGFHWNNDIDTGVGQPNQIQANPDTDGNDMS